MIGQLKETESAEYSERHAMQTDMGISAQIDTDFPLTVSSATELLGLSYIPGFSGFSYSTAEQHSDIGFHLTESPAHALIQEPHQIRWSDTWNNSLNLDFFHAMYAMVRTECMHRALFPTHAAAVGDDTDGHILLAAYPSNGKTSTLLHLVDTYGFSVFSGDKTVVGFDGDTGLLTGVAGTQAITARNVVFERYAPSLAATQYLDRKAVLLPEQYYDRRPVVPVKAIMIVREDPAVSESEQMNPISATHRLLPFFLDQTNAHKVFTEADGSVKGIIEGNPPTGTLLKLAVNLSRALQRTPTYLITGSIPFIGQEIGGIYGHI